MPQGSAALPATCAAPREEACEGAQPSLGAISNGSANAGPYQLTHAESNTGSLDATYDVCGNMTSLSVSRPGAQCAGGTSCEAQHFEYEWDEIGRLVRAKRFDDSGPNGPPEALAADLRYHYDSSDNRTLKTATDTQSIESHSVYLFPSLELRGSQFGTDYEVSAQTEVAYLFATGVRLARLVNDPNGSGLDTSGVRVFFELGDHLGSTSVALDQATGELVERSTYQAYGGAESTYRPERWGSFREDYRFTGKEEDVEVGLVYFGKRFYNPLLQRWVSADPLEVHEASSGEPNVYAYVSGRALQAVDPLGLAEGANSSECATGSCGASSTTDLSESENQSLAPAESPAGAAATAPINAEEERARAEFEHSANQEAHREPGEYAQRMRIVLPMVAMGQLATTGMGAPNLALAPRVAAQASRPAPAPHPVPQGGSLKNRSGGTQTAANAARNQPYGAGPHAARGAGKIKWPPNRGFAGTPKSSTLSPGTRIDRYGSELGTFASPAGTPFGARSLPQSAASSPLRGYEVVKPLPTQSGTAAPWLDRPEVACSTNWDSPSRLWSSRASCGGCHEAPRT